MRYQLVLQWPASEIADYDALVGIEGLLIEGLVNDKVDGHDMGSGEVNIFILTDDPHRTFDEINAVLRPGGLWSNARAAYREISASNYSVLWPVDLKHFVVS
jgi:hypothetical protein